MSADKQMSAAEPQTREQVQLAPRRPEVVQAAFGRGIDRIVHFTTVTALLGIL